MEIVNIPRIVIAATQSSSGKTTVVTGILRALRNQGIVVQPFKVGPDYIDPSYHGMAAGRQGHNLDTWLVAETKLNELVATESKGAEIAVIEGVMGLYDGGKNGISSTAAIAKKLQAPVILVINCQSMGDSAAAIALGFQQYDPEVNLAGVILNRLGSATHRTMIEEAMERLGIPVLGSVMRDAEMHLPERHLGLTPAQEAEAKTTIDKISEKIATEVDLAQIVELANTAPPLVINKSEEKSQQTVVKIAIARDKAFSFYYPASLDMLTKMGAELVFFSPLTDSQLPQDCSAVIIGGGFPEVFAQELSENISMLDSLRQAAALGMPIYAECGGFMYLMRGIYDFEDKYYQMAGIIPATARMQKKLQTVGYVQAELLQDSIIGSKGSKLNGHEFHFSVQEAEAEAEFPWAFEFTKMRNSNRYPAGYNHKNVLGSYLHMHFLGSPKAARCLVEQAKKFAQGQERK